MHFQALESSLDQAPLFVRVQLLTDADDAVTAARKGARCHKNICFDVICYERALGTDCCGCQHVVPPILDNGTFSHNS